MQQYIKQRIISAVNDQPVFKAKYKFICRNSKQIMQQDMKYNRINDLSKVYKRTSNKIYSLHCPVLL